MPKRDCRLSAAAHEVGFHERGQCEGSHQRENRNENGHEWATNRPGDNRSVTALNNVKLLSGIGRWLALFSIALTLALSEEPVRQHGHNRERNEE